MPYVCSRMSDHNSVLLMICAELISCVSQKRICESITMFALADHVVHITYMLAISTQYFVAS